MSLGDLSALRVRAECKLGDDVAVRAVAFPGREFTDKIVNIAPIIRPELKSPDSRNFTDFSVTEVPTDLADPGPLVEGMKVDVYCPGNDAR
jgi:hypothetical protein